MRRGLPFLFGHVLSAMLIGALGGVMLNTGSIISFSVLMGLGALASGVMCNWLPGYDSPGWQLWLAGAFTNPLLLVAISFTSDAADCVIGKAKGPSCLFGDIGPLVIGVCLVPPLIGVAFHWLLRPPAPLQVPPMPGEIPGSTPEPRPTPPPLRSDDL